MKTQNFIRCFSKTLKAYKYTRIAGEFSSYFLSHCNFAANWIYKVTVKDKNFWVA